MASSGAQPPPGPPRDPRGPFGHLPEDTDNPAVEMYGFYEAHNAAHKRKADQLAKQGGGKKARGDSDADMDRDNAGVSGADGADDSEQSERSEEESSDSDNEEDEDEGGHGEPNPNPGNDNDNDNDADDEESENGYTSGYSGSGSGCGLNERKDFGKGNRGNNFPPNGEDDGLSDELAGSTLTSWKQKQARQTNNGGEMKSSDTSESSHTLGRSDLSSPSASSHTIGRTASVSLHTLSAGTVDGDTDAAGSSDDEGDLFTQAYRQGSKCSGASGSENGKSSSTGHSAEMKMESVGRLLSVEIDMGLLDSEEEDSEDPDDYALSHQLDISSEESDSRGVGHGMMTRGRARKRTGM